MLFSHTVAYYLAVILVFRPFLVSSHAIQSGTRRGAHDDMWLHQACRHAVNAAQDSIRFTSDALRKVEACRVGRPSLPFSPLSPRLRSATDGARANQSANV